MVWLWAADGCRQIARQHGGGRLARLVESALESGDVYEARRAALVLAQLYPEAESWPVWARAFAEE